MNRVFGDIAIYWINLASSTDRAAHMTNQLENTNHTRIDAIDGTDSKTFKSQFTIVNPRKAFSTALIAVLCSHVKAIKMAYDNKLPYVIVLEDKCHFEYINYFKHTVIEIIDLVAKKDINWELVQLFSVPIYENLSDYKTNGLQVHKRVVAYNSLNYLINYKGMEKILSTIPTDAIQYFDMTQVQKYPAFESSIYDSANTYIINFPLFYTYAEKSTFEKYLNRKNQSKEANNLIQLEVKRKLHDYYSSLHKSANVI